jgi:signal transduction histidine kinase
LDADRIEVQLQPVTLHPLLSRTIESVRAKRAHHKFEILIQEDLPYVLADEPKLDIILHNLLTNAVNYSSPDSTITVEARKDNGHVVISVADEGVGIPPEHRERIFERFYRVNPADSQRVYGYGLGLYICKKLVEAQGGRIWVESQEGVWSRFSFSLKSFTTVAGEDV